MNGDIKNLYSFLMGRAAFFEGKAYECGALIQRCEETIHELPGTDVANFAENERQAMERTIDAYIGLASYYYWRAKYEMHPESGDDTE